MQIWSINCYILKMPRYTNIVYIGRYLVLTYTERLKQQQFAAFLAIFVGQEIAWLESVNSVTFFWHVRKLRQDLYLRALILSFMKSSFVTPWYFFCFIWSTNCLRDFFSHFVSQYIVWVESLNHRTYLGDVT